VSLQAAAEPAARARAAKLSLGPTAALLFVARSFQYVAFGVTGVVLARGLGPDGRGVYGLINETAAMAASFPGLGFDVMETPELAMALAGAALIMVNEGAVEWLMPLGRPWSYTIVKIFVPLVRLAGILAIVFAADLSTEGAAAVWLASIAAGALLVVALLSRDLRFRPGIDLKALRAQASFGSRIHFGWILQALNHRLDVFLVGYFVGTAGVGYYLVGVNLAELAWWVPLALGTVLFPKVSAMGAEDNFLTSARACRRTLAVTSVASLGLLAVAHPMIPVVYGGDFAPSATVFMILLPSGLLFTVHKVLTSSLAANGKPQASLYAGLISLPVTIGLNLLLVPSWGIKGAAVASDVAYAVNASAVLFLFLRSSRLPLRDVLLFNAEDWEAVTWTVRNVWSRRVLRNAAYTPGVTE
jgi:O-antigen/teichoic acid export membrane protein